MWFRKKTNTPFVPLTFPSGTLASVTIDEWQALRAFYLRALKDHRTCSSDDFESMQALSPDGWKALIEKALIDPASLLLAYTDKNTGAILGLMYLRGREEGKRSHETELHIYYVTNEAMALAPDLWDGAFAYLKSATGVKRIKAAVHSQDTDALQLFLKIGFVRYGFDEQYYQIGKAHLDAVLLMKKL